MLKCTARLSTNRALYKTDERMRRIVKHTTGTEHKHKPTTPRIIPVHSAHACDTRINLPSENVEGHNISKLNPPFDKPLLYRHFGVDYLAGGELDTKFIRPVYEDEIIDAFAKVVGDEGGMVELEVWCETSEGRTCTVGRASVRRSAA